MTKMQCEQCGQRITEEGAKIYRKYNHMETVTLAFCEGCWQHE